MVLSDQFEGDFPMFSLSRKALEFVAASSLVLLAVTTPVRADDTVQNLGPVGPQQPIIATVGDKRVIAFFAPSDGHCNVQAVIWTADDTSAKSASAIRFQLDPDQTVSIDSSLPEQFALKCGANGDTLSSLSSRQFASR